ncbi:radical SAM protein [candidate division WOR-3 bacterium]|nr:radical SAM protein [candidate division WOR-3 bacterium]
MKRKFFRYTQLIPSFGLRFLKENIPEIEVLEYPDWGKFEKEIRKGVDILGISFYMRNVAVVKRMIELARSAGVKKIWGGNYGVLCDEVRPFFDRVFIGYAENEIARTLGKEDIDKIKHPLLISSIGMPYLPFKMKFGFLFTSRGCNLGCKFCQTPAFVHKRTLISKDCIEEVLKRYQKEKVNWVSIGDENFLINDSHSRQIINLLSHFRFRWVCMTRLDLLKGKVKWLRKKGLMGCLVGIESLRQENLDSLDKRERIGSILDTVKELRENRVTTQGTYMLGHLNDTEQSIRKDIKKLSLLDIQSMQFFILTPFPHTHLQKEINSKYGIFEKDYSKYDCENLVWNHPNIEPEKLKEILNWSYTTFYSIERHFKKLISFFQARYLK